MTSRRVKSTVALVVAISAVAILDVAHATYYSRDAFFPGNGLPDAAIAALVYYEETAVSTMGYTGHTLAARTEFDNVTDAVINFRKATSSEINTAPLRILMKTGGNSRDLYWYGHTTNYDINGNELGTVDAQYYAWSKVDLLLNHDKMEYKGLNSNQRRRVAVHEMGHVMSMKHQPIGYSHLASVMQDDSYESWSLTSVDIVNLQYMY